MFSKTHRLKKAVSIICFPLKMPGISLRVAGVCLILSFLAPPPVRADVLVTLELDRQEATLEDSIRLVVKVSGTRHSAPQPLIHGLEAFHVTQGGTSSRVEIINGKVNAGIDYTFFIQPQKTGTFQIGPADISLQGRTVKSNRVTLKIVKASQAASADQRPLFLTAALSSKEAYVEEQVLYTLKLYLRTSVSYRRPELPQIEHLPFKQVGEPREYRSVHNGKTYNVLELNYLLLPSKEGMYDIPPSKMQLTVYEPKGRSRPRLFDDPFFNDPFFSRGRPMILASEPLNLRVLPLPIKGRPSDFSGLVGEFSVESKLEPSEIKAGESATLTVSLAGRGNVNRLPNLKGPVLQKTKVYADEPVLNIETDYKGMKGSKTMKWAIVPEKEGLYQIAPLFISYFDTSAKKYRIIKTSFHTLKVRPGKKGEVMAQGEQRKPKKVEGPLKKEIEEVGRDILPAHTSIRDFSTGFRVRPGGPLFWLIILAPLFAYAAMFWGLRSRKRSEASIAASRAKRAARELIRQCHKRNLVFSDFSAAVRSYVNDRFGLSIGSLTPEEAGKILRSRAVTPATAKEFEGFIQRLEDAVYTGKGNDPCDMGKETPGLVKKIEKEIR